MSQTNLPPKPWPKLSVILPAAKALHRCQGCEAGAHETVIGRYRECDEDDRPTNVVILLCADCWARIGDPHPRAYVELGPFDPHPGSMPICEGCRSRDGTRCTHPDAKANGGAGVMLTMLRPVTGFVDGSNYRGPFVHWRGPVASCKQRVELGAVCPSPEGGA